MELEFYIPKLGLIPRCIRPVRPVADLYDLFKLASQIVLGQARKDIKYRMLPVQQNRHFARRGAAKKSKKLGYY